MYHTISLAEGINRKIKATGNNIKLAYTTVLNPFSNKLFEINEKYIQQQNI
jgi:hypothetical protein